MQILRNITVGMVLLMVCFHAMAAENVDIGTITVNCSYSAGEEERVVQFHVVLNGKGEDFSESVVRHLPMIMHEIILLTGDRTGSELESENGKENLSLAIRDQLHVRLQSVSLNAFIKSVLFTSFIVQ